MAARAKGKARSPAMVALFRRIGVRRYEIEVLRTEHPNLKMSPAPGYGPFMPHDLLHFVVEARLGLSGGVFGQLAAGGNARTFHATESTASSCGKRGFEKRGEKLLREGRADSAQSERATYICWYEWRRRSKVDSERRAAAAMTRQTDALRAVAPAAELHVLTEEKLRDISRHLDELSARWSQLEIGEAVAINWPTLELVAAV